VSAFLESTIASLARELESRLGASHGLSEKQDLMLHEYDGRLTSEHGVGMEKSELMPVQFSDADFDLMRRVYDAFNFDSSPNPEKLFQSSNGCGEIRVGRPLPVPGMAGMKR